MLQHKGTVKDDWRQVWAMERFALQSLLNGKGNAPADKGEAFDTGNAAIIPITGFITKYNSDPGWTSTLTVQQKLENALYDDSVDSIILYIDSPGGHTSGSIDLANYIETAKTLKPIHAYISDMGCSAAYWIASQCTSVFANESAEIGSIGVYAVLTDTSAINAAMGVKFTVVSSGEFKGLGADGSVDDKYVGQMQRQVNDINNLFVSAVSEGRKILQPSLLDICDGRTWIARDAMNLNLIDGIGTLNDVAQYIKGNDMVELKGNLNTPAIKAADADEPDVKSDSEILKQILSSIQDMVAKIDKLTDEVGDNSDDDSDESEDDTATDAVAKGDEVKAAVAAETARTADIIKLCAGRNEYATKCIKDNKSVMEAKAGLVDLLEKENTELKANAVKAKAFEGSEPIALGSVTGIASDPEKIWASNQDDIQKKWRGNKKLFMIDFRDKDKK